MDIVSRQVASSQGLRYYFTGKPCKNGHIAERHIQGMCKECRAQYTKDNVNTIKASSRRYTERNRDKENARLLALYHKKRADQGFEKYVPYEVCEYQDKEELLNQNELQELLSYDPTSGLFTWLKKGNPYSRVEGEIAGSTSKDGYIVIKIKGISYLAHRLAFLYMEGEWPEDDVDHKNKPTSNNAWLNLRHADDSLNMQNKTKAIKNKIHSKYLGVHKAPDGINFTAKITVRGKRYFLGTFPTEELAYAAYLEAKRELHEGCMI